MMRWVGIDEAGYGPNKPLKFRLEKLERSHPYLEERGLTTETLVDFGAGFCAKGMMAGRIAIPIHNPNGEVVAYAGRYAGEPDKDTPKGRRVVVGNLIPATDWQTGRQTRLDRRW